MRRSPSVRNRRETRALLDANAEECTRDAVDELARAIDAIVSSHDDDALEKIAHATVLLGEARGHRNAAFDLLDDR